MEVHLLHPKDVPSVWEEVQPLIDKALKYSAGEILASDILKSLFDETQGLWVGHKDNKLFCAGITAVVDYPQKRVLRIITFATKTGKDYNIWKDFIYTLEDFGKSLGCTAIEAWSRKGLNRKLKWDHEYSVITKNI